MRWRYSKFWRFIHYRRIWNDFDKSYEYGGDRWLFVKLAPIRLFFDWKPRDYGEYVMVSEECITLANFDLLERTIDRMDYSMRSVLRTTWTKYHRIPDLGSIQCYVKRPNMLTCDPLIRGVSIGVKISTYRAKGWFRRTPQEWAAFCEAYRKLTFKNRFRELMVKVA